ncbi:hypothetical protein O9H85_18845 [Paenibacillus filicis]|uniref:Uncharacterized protein n=1 Tax=Paenibacillus gyeongsangnamensis TaxID=3388067 RepID=A0ABT4QC37_9BACL|nr:hypothetical protein [Paenibacillus filicis]MCZ8514440.1 hypothetical protein [Paenibacillus filicis]
MSSQEQDRLNETQMTDEQYRGALRAFANAAPDMASQAHLDLERQPGGEPDAAMK